MTQASVASAELRSTGNANPAPCDVKPVDYRVVSGSKQQFQH
ncbi:MAG: hypothetical protein ACRCWJ_13295 [Casimicrobium sp.]